MSPAGMRVSRAASSYEQHAAPSKEELDAGYRTRVAVIIPYYQTAPGLLRSAVSSVLAQSLPSGVLIDIFVIDDGSPHPAAVELSGLQMSKDRRLVVLSIPNSGPGAARNRGLDRVPADTDYVALLDSDDVWRPTHLANAISQLDAGADFYFSNHRRPSFTGEQSAFAVDARLQDWLLRPAEAPFVEADEARGLFHFRPGRAFNELLENYMAQTSTVAFRWDRARELRFEPRLRAAGEDHLFWLNLASVADRVCFSTAEEVECGSGVNLYFSAFDWSHPSCAQRVGYLTLLYTLVGQVFDLDSRGRALIAQRRKTYGEAFAYLWSTQALKRRAVDWGLVKELVRVRPTAVAELFWWGASVAVARLVNRQGFASEWK